MKKMIKDFYKRNSLKEWVVIVGMAMIISCLSMNDFEGWNGAKDIMTLCLCFALFVVVGTFLKGAACNWRDMLVSGLCGGIFAVFMLAGILTEKDAFWMIYSKAYLLKILIYLITRSIMYGMLVLGLFKALASNKARGGRARARFRLFGL